MVSNTIQYLTDTQGEPSAVVIPIDLWRKIFPGNSITSTENIAEEIEDYCLNQATDEATETPLLDREAALEFLEDDSD